MALADLFKIFYYQDNYYLDAKRVIIIIFCLAGDFQQPNMPQKLFYFVVYNTCFSDPPKKEYLLLHQVPNLEETLRTTARLPPHFNALIFISFGRFTTVLEEHTTIVKHGKFYLS